VRESRIAVGGPAVEESALRVASLVDVVPLYRRSARVRAAQKCTEQDKQIPVTLHGGSD
jgi:hypothetical protein